MKELKPCPFCGKQPATRVSMWQNNSITFHITCDNCKISMYSENRPYTFELLSDDMDEMIDKWNTRYE